MRGKTAKLLRKTAAINCPEDPKPLYKVLKSKWQKLNHKERSK